ncbi:putative transporter [Cyphellophora attinorum]|uniref:Putative transporter n=1 Tax=Cyphellophora attinorum TaxID=1664694 RepID=A0A0N1P0L2_9EURO|nr:putative transporter [Phialophora attinorum]KPI39180.1 putative transporter [Phialophora attinorum]
MALDDKIRHQHHDDEVGLPHSVNRDELVTPEYVEGTPDEAKLVRKIDLRLMPTLIVMYIFNYLDRTNIGNAKVGGMQTDLKLTSSDYSLVLSIFFVGYLIFEPPAVMILARTRPSIFLPAIMTAWGAVSVAVKGIDSLGGMLAFRVVLSLLEAGFFPGVMLLLSCWYKPSELSKRIAIFYCGTILAGAFGGLLAGGIIDGMEGVGGVRGWKWLFIIEGLATVIVGVVAFFTLPDYPQNTKWLSEDERRLASMRLIIREDLDEKMPYKKAILLSIRDPKLWLFMLALNVILASGTVSYFFPTLMGALGYKGRMVQFMTVPIYAVTLVINLAMGFSADYTRQKAFHVIGCAGLAVLSFIICAASTSFPVRYAFICFASPVTMFPGRERRAVSVPLINGFGNLASVYGSVHCGFATMTCFMFIAGVTAFVVKWIWDDKGLERIDYAAQERQEEAERRKI